MGLRMQRLLSDFVDALDPGQYMRHEVIHVCCPLCGKTTVLDPERYVVDRGGKVTPAFRCPMCPLVEWLELESP